MSAQASTLVDYYRENVFNPVPIDLRTPEALALHTAKRRNLYEGHLGIPLGLLSGQNVLEFGCNSGENAVVLARAGAHLTLVEPNEQAHERLRTLFKTFGLTERLTALHGCGIDEYPEDKTYQLALAEGFLFTLANRDAMVSKICRLLAPGGIGVISFNCRFGGLIELHKRLAVFRACELSGVPPQSEASLALAQELFASAFGRIKATRPFAAWWKDLLVNPFYADRYLWSYSELLPLVEAAGCRFLSTSPRWFAGEQFRWYKDVPSTRHVHSVVDLAWRRTLGGILTGKPTRAEVPADQAVVEAIASLTRSISDYCEGSAELGAVALPAVFNAWLDTASDPALRTLAHGLRGVHAALAEDSPAGFAARVAQSGLAELWGSALHYLSFTRSNDGV